MPQIAMRLRVKQAAEPMDHRRPVEAAEYPAIDAGVIVWPRCDPRQLAACHQHDAAAPRLDELALLCVGLLDFVEISRRARLELIGARATPDEAARVSRLCDAALDELAGNGPAQSHAALRGVHAFGHAQAVRPHVAAAG